MDNENICDIVKAYEELGEFSGFNDMLHDEFGDGTCEYDDPILDVNNYFENTTGNWVVAVLYDIQEYPDLEDFQIAFRYIEDSVRFKLKYG